MRAEKIQMVREIGEILRGSDYVFLVAYKGLNVKDMTELRRGLAAHKGTCRILKNRLIRKASAEIGIKELAELKLTGDTAVVFGKGDPGPVAKAIMAFAKTHEKLVAKNGLFEGRLMGADDVKEIANLPSIDVLRSQLLGLLASPSRSLVTVLYMKSSELLNVLNAFKGKLESKQ